MMDGELCSPFSSCAEQILFYVWDQKIPQNQLTRFIIYTGYTQIKVRKYQNQQLLSVTTVKLTVNISNSQQ